MHQPTHDGAQLILISSYIIYNLRKRSSFAARRAVIVMEKKIDINLQKGILHKKKFAKKNTQNKIALNT
jgi:hypothetical protein